MIRKAVEVGAAYRDDKAGGHSTLLSSVSVHRDGEVPPGPTNQERVVIICQCAVVSDRSVIEAVASGARNLAQVCRATDAGQDCGACVFNVRRVISEYRSAHDIG